MPYCRNCGNQVSTEARICPNCGYAQEAAQPAPGPVAYPQVPPAPGTPPAAPGGIPPAAPGTPPAAPPGLPPTPPQAFGQPQSFGGPPMAYVQPRNDGGALASLILGIVGIVFCPLILSIVALFVGLSAKRRIEESNGALGGRDMAKAGIILGIIGIVLGILGVIFFIGLFATGYHFSQTHPVPIRTFGPFR